MAMKKDTLRLWSLLLFFAVFEVAVYILFSTDNAFFPDEWFRPLVYFAAPAVGLSQIAILAMWVGFGSSAMLQRIFYATSGCLFGLLLPMAIGQLFIDIDSRFVWNGLLVLPFAFALSLVGSLIFGRVFRRRLVVLNAEGQAPIVARSQFSLRFLSVATLTIGLLFLLGISCRPPEPVDAFDMPNWELIPGLIVVAICFTQGIAFTWILLAPTRIRAMTCVWLAIAAAVLLYFISVIWSWWNTSSPESEDYRAVLIAIAALFGTSLVCLAVMRWLNFRLVRIDQPNVVVKDPAEASADSLRMLLSALRPTGIQLRRPWIALPILALLSWIAYDWFLFDGRIRVSKETTFLTEPLRPDGMVDYCAAINERLKSGIKSEDNAAVDLIRVLGPQVVPEDCASEFYRWLELDPLLSYGDNVVFYRDFPEAIAELASANPKGAPPRGVLWSAAQFPVAAMWLDANRRQLEIVRAASRKPHFFLPIVTPNDELLTIHDSLLTSYFRNLALMLDADAMYELQRGNWQAALEDIATIGRIGQLLMKRGTYIDWLIGKTILEVKHGLQLTLIEQIGPQDLAEFVELSAELHIQPIMSFRDACGLTERLINLDMIVFATQTDYRIFEYSDLKGPATTTKPLTAQLCRPSDWNEVLRVFNDLWNEFEAAADISDRDARLARLEELDNRCVEYEQPLFSHMFPHSLWTRTTRGRRIAALLNGSYAPPWELTETSQLRTESVRDLDEISLALEAFRAVKGVYPTSLDELAPMYLENIPLDQFIDKPYSYRLEPGGYLLYGVGRDLIDDQGNPSKDVVARINRVQGN